MSQHSFGGTSLKAFDVTMPRLWTTEHHAISGTASVFLKVDVLKALVTGATTVWVRVPYGAQLQENQLERVIDACMAEGFLYHESVVMTVGPHRQWVVLSRQLV